MRKLSQERGPSSRRLTRLGSWRVAMSPGLSQPFHLSVPLPPLLPPLPSLSRVLTGDTHSKLRRGTYLRRTRWLASCAREQGMFPIDPKGCDEVCWGEDRRGRVRATVGPTHWLGRLGGVPSPDTVGAPISPRPFPPLQRLATAFSSALFLLSLGRVTVERLLGRVSAPPAGQGRWVAGQV